MNHLYTKSSIKEVVSSDETVRGYTDISVITETPFTVRYTSGDLICVEGMIDDRYCHQFWSADGRINLPSELFEQPIFKLVIDHNTLTNWEFVGAKDGSLTQKGARHYTVTLKSKDIPITVIVHTLLDGTPVVTRYLEVINQSEQAKAVDLLAPFTPRLWRGSQFSLGYFTRDSWSNEGFFEWTDVGIGLNTIEHTRGLEFNHPFFVVKNLVSGEYFYGSFAWNGNWKLDFHRDQEGLSLFASEIANASLRVMKKDEHIFSPEMHIAHTSSSLDDATQQFHKHLRHFVLPHRNQDNTMLIQYLVPADQGYYTPFDEATALKCVDVAKEIGAEAFILDAYWWDVTCDWVPSAIRFPNGLDKLISYIKENGMKFGLYVETEGGRGNIIQSKIYREHPEWFFSEYNILDISLQEVSDYMEAEICKIIETYQVDIFRLDYNCMYYGDGTYHTYEGILENSHHRYYHNFAEVYKRIAQRYPHVVLQQAAAGGARNDLATAQVFHESYLTDGLSIPREFIIYAGQTLALPPELFVILHGADGSNAGNVKPQNLDTILRLSYAMGTPQIFVASVAPSVEQLMPNRLERYRHYAKMYRELFRKVLPTSRVFHHEPVNDYGGYRSSPWFAMEFSSPDATQGWGVVLRMFHGAGDRYYNISNEYEPLYPEKSPDIPFVLSPTYLFMPKGINPALNYRVTIDSINTSFVVGGYQLMNEGILLRLENAGMSDLVIYEVV